MTVKALFATCLVESIDKREFAKVALDKNPETFIIHIAALKATGANGMIVHPL